MAYVFTEYIPGELDLFPDRNPLTEVRWWGFLTGDAYANPFHDLLYAVSRSATAGPGAAVGKRTAEFTADRLILTGGDGTTVTYLYAELELLKLNHTGFQDNASFQLVV